MKKRASRRSEEKRESPVTVPRNVHGRVAISTVAATQSSFLATESGWQVGTNLVPRYLVISDGYVAPSWCFVFEVSLVMQGILKLCAWCVP